MADRVPHLVTRQLLTRARRRTGVLVVMLGLMLAAALPSIVLATTASATAGSSDAAPIVAATTDATPAPAATPKPGEPGSTETGAAWVRTSPTPAESLAPLLLGAVVLVILVVLIAMSFGESTEARSTGR